MRCFNPEPSCHPSRSSRLFNPGTLISQTSLATARDRVFLCADTNDPSSRRFPRIISTTFTFSTTAHPEQNSPRVGGGAGDLLLFSLLRSHSERINSLIYTQRSPGALLIALTFCFSSQERAFMIGLGHAVDSYRRRYKRRLVVWS